jgi:hydroxymethylpyrimidine pyrophosphatase-like HAD family hydrolase
MSSPISCPRLPTVNRTTLIAMTTPTATFVANTPVAAGSANCNNHCAVHCLFSDVDGTLVHYPKDFNEYATIVSEDDIANTATIRYNISGEERECVVLTSMTGGKAYMSTATVSIVERLRAMGVLFVIITGARSSTYLQRRRVLPRADYEFCENGGRMLADGVLVPNWTDSFEDQVGSIADRCAVLPPGLDPPERRDGSLWDLHNKMKADGWKIDARDYVTNFRVDVAKSVGKSVDDFYAATAAELAPRKLASSFNLGKADIYPAGSGKANAAANVLRIKGWSPSDAVAMFDDDNDLELGALVGRSFLPGVTHQSVLDAMKNQGESWTVTKSRGFLGTEEALMAVVALREESMSQFAK